MNENIEHKMSNSIGALSVSEKVCNSGLLPAWTQVRGVSRDAEALRTICALHPKGITNLDILNPNLFRPDLIRSSLIKKGNSGGSG